LHPYFLFCFKAKVKRGCFPFILLQNIFFRFFLLCFFCLASYISFCVAFFASFCFISYSFYMWNLRFCFKAKQVEQTLCFASKRREFCFRFA
jgi:hypothetical protein